MNCKELWREARALLAGSSDCADFEANELLRHFCGLSRTQLAIGTTEVSEEDCARLREALRRRMTGYPLQYLLGEWDFYGRTFWVGEGVLIPRADTETLVEAALVWASQRLPQGAAGKALQIADLCAGSGCIAITLAVELAGSVVYAVEKSPAALAYLRENAARLGGTVQIQQDDVRNPAKEYPVFDLIVSNPPYIPREDLSGLQAEVQREPEMALCGGTDGLDFYRGITDIWAARLKPGGMLAYEIGLGQETAVKKILENKCFENVCFHRDLCGIIRVVSGIRNPFSAGAV